MTDYAKDPEQAFEFTTRILCDPLPVQLDAAYIVCETVDSQDSGILAAAYCWAQDVCYRVVICDEPARNGYAGSPYVRAALNRQLVSRVVSFSVPEQNFNTYTEAVELVKFAASNGIKTLGIVAPAHHLVRAYVSAVSCTVKYHPELKLYAVPGILLPWQNTVKHSQGTVVGTRAELLQGEWKRLSEYSAKGDLLPLEEVLKYMDKREAR